MMNRRESLFSPGLERIAFKLLSEEERLDLILTEGRVSYLLIEQLDNADLAELKRTLDTTKEQLEQVLTKFGEGGANLKQVADIGQYLDALKKTLNNAEKSVAELDLEGDPEGIANVARKYWGQGADAAGITRAVMAVQGRAAQFTDSLKGGVQKVVGALAGFDDLDRTKSIASQAGTKNIPDASKIRGAIQKAVKGSVPTKGPMAKLMGFFKKGKGLEDEVLATLTPPDLVTLADALMGKTLDELELISTELGKLPPTEPPPTEPAEHMAATSAAPPEGATEPGMSSEETVAADAEADTVADDLGTGTISKQELTALLKKYDQVGGKGAAATRHRRIFRKAVNQAAGKEVFEERLNVMRKSTNLPRLAEVLLPMSEPRPKLQRQGQRPGLQQPRDHEIVAERWLTLAGLEED